MVRLRRTQMILSFLAAIVVSAWIGPACLAQERSKWFNPERHLALEKVKSGMTGYGLSVFSGTELKKFDVKVIDVIQKFRPKRAVILVELDGENLKQTGVIAGMSGSPIFLPDPDDGKYKMAGAVAYGWPFSRQGSAIGGVQPIEQVLAVGASGEVPKEQASSETKPGELTRKLLTNLPKLSGQVDRPLLGRYTAAGLIDADVDKTSSPRERLRELSSGLVPLATPINVAGLDDQLAGAVASVLGGYNRMVVKGASVSGGAVTGGKIESAGPVFIPLILGDLNLGSVGTVTEVIGDRVWVFGHGMERPSEGSIEMPMATGVIHTIIPQLESSWKFGSASEVVGTFSVDESSGVFGQLGKAPPMPPVNISVSLLGRRSDYHYQIVQHRQETPFWTMISVLYSIIATNGPPELHTIEYKSTVTFENIGQIEIQNITSDQGLFFLLTDIIDPIDVMLNNPFERIRPTRIDVEVQIKEESRLATIVDARLDKLSYRPGETARVFLNLLKFRAGQMDRTIEFTVPADLPDGEYNMSLGGLYQGVAMDRQSKPNLYEPTSISELFQAIKYVSGFKSNRIYAGIEQNRPGLGIKRHVLADLPGSKLAQLQSANPGRVTKIAPLAQFDVPADFILTDAAKLKLKIARDKLVGQEQEEQKQENDY